MARLLILGSAAAISDAEHDNTYVALQGDEDGTLLVDCGANPLVKLKGFGVEHEHLTGVILTHFHPDHVFGLPLLLMQLWLLGRTRPLHLYGLHDCLTRVETMMVSFGWEAWPDFFPVVFHRLPDRDGMLVLDSADFRITAWPTRHFIPTIGLRIEVKSSGRVVSFSGDTEPTDRGVALARDADLLVHEAAGEGEGHSSAAQAGHVATLANARRLALIHYPVSRDGFSPTALLDDARSTFSGPIVLARDLDQFEI